MTSREDYIKRDYRAFVFAIHPRYGMLLLYCTRKKKKGPHCQCPGGHVDKEDYDDITLSNVQGSELLIEACKRGAARELYEETSIDVRSALDRLQSVRLRKEDNTSKVIGEFKGRMFFKLYLKDSDFVSDELLESPSVVQPLNMKPPHLMIKLSHEHNGFLFEPDVDKAVELLIEHSGGKVSRALQMAIDECEIKSIKVEDESNANINDEKNESKIIGSPRENEELSQLDNEGGICDCLNCWC